MFVTRQTLYPKNTAVSPCAAFMFLCESRFALLLILFENLANLAIFNLFNSRHIISPLVASFSLFLHPLSICPPFPSRWVALLPGEILRNERCDRVHRHQQRLWRWFIQAVLQSHQPPEQPGCTERSARLSANVSTFLSVTFSCSHWISQAVNTAVRCCLQWRPGEGSADMAVGN